MTGTKRKHTCLDVVTPTETSKRTRRRSCASPVSILDVGDLESSTKQSSGRRVTFAEDTKRHDSRSVITTFFEDLAVWWLRLDKLSGIPTLGAVDLVRRVIIAQLPRHSPEAITWLLRGLHNRLVNRISHLDEVQATQAEATTTLQLCQTVLDAADAWCAAGEQAGVKGSIVFPGLQPGQPGRAEVLSTAATAMASLKKCEKGVPLVPSGGRRKIRIALKVLVPLERLEAALRELAQEVDFNGNGLANAAAVL